MTKGKIGLLLGPTVFIILLLFSHPPGMPREAQAVLAVTAWVAIWWITEAVPLAATALLPIILFPLTGSVSINDTTAAYGHKYIFLFMGGFMLAIAIEKWNLHKRIALTIIKVVGVNVVSIIWGFMIATAFLSMWISNTATTVMILPVGMAIVAQLRENPKSLKTENLKLGKALMLSIAYSASIGGMATLIGTPPNLILAGVLQETYGTEISFFRWFLIGFPVAIFLLLICWLYLTRVAFKFEQKKIPGGKEEISRQLLALGKISTEERMVLVVFALAAFAWMTRSFLLNKVLPAIDDSIIAITCAIILFMLPTTKKGEHILVWKDMKQLPWGILLLFGGGMALALGFESSGLALWIGEQFDSKSAIPLFLFLFLVIAAVNLITEIASNLATTVMLLPVLISLSPTLDIHPYFLTVGATMAASCAFMLPVATPPNAVVFGSGYLKIEDMVKKGIWMNILSTIILTLFVYYILPLIWNFS